jgi:hypothetical protein
MRIDPRYMAQRRAGMPKKIRKAGQQILAEENQGLDLGARIREKGQLAVQQLQKADEHYAQAVASAFNTANNPMVDQMVATPLSNIRGMTPTSSYEGQGGIGPRTVEQSQNISGIAGDAGIMAANVGVRYGLPAAGIALAAKGIGDVAFGGPSDQQEPNQLDMVNVAGMTAAGAGVAMAPAIYNEVRDPKYRGQSIGKGKAALVSALGAGGGALTSAIGQTLF